jgi:hypothetical protein
MARNMSRENNHSTNSFPSALKPSRVTLLGYGALMSESSSRLTFPDLSDFRYVRVKSMRRVFAHPHTFLLGEGLIDPEQTNKLGSLSVEPAADNVSFVAVAFDVTLDDDQRRNFIEREKEYKIVSTPYYSIHDHDSNSNSKNDNYIPAGDGVICIASKDAELINVNIPDSIKGKGGIWHWPHDSGLLPANTYLRHCLLALQKVGGVAYESFLQDTYLADRKTSLAVYLKNHNQEVMESLPPQYLAERFGG